MAAFWRTFRGQYGRHFVSDGYVDFGFDAINYHGFVQRLLHGQVLQPHFFDANGIGRRVYGDGRLPFLYFLGIGFDTDLLYLSCLGRRKSG